MSSATDPCVINIVKRDYELHPSLALFSPMRLVSIFFLPSVTARFPLSPQSGRKSRGLNFVGQRKGLAIH